jgi:putative transposase
MCNVLEVSRTSFYQWRNASECDEYSSLKEDIASIYSESSGCYGFRRILEQLRVLGYNCGKKLVIKLMKALKIQGFAKKRSWYHNAQRQREVYKENILNRDFSPTKPNEVWSSDITYVWTKQGWVFLAVILDLYSRRVVSWSVAKTQDTELVMSALLKAINARKPQKGLVIHTDQGSQYTSRIWANMIRTVGFVHSMSRKGQCWDNAPTESWNSTLKRESSIIRRVCNNINDLKKELNLWIEGWYNPKRLHSTLNYKSPEQFEKAYFSTVR